MGGLEPEQKKAELLRTLYRVGLIKDEVLHRLINDLQIQLFERYIKSKNQPDSI